MIVMKIEEDYYFCSYLSWARFYGCRVKILRCNSSTNFTQVVGHSSTASCTEVFLLFFHKKNRPRTIILKSKQRLWIIVVLVYLERIDAGVNCMRLYYTLLRVFADRYEQRVLSPNHGGRDVKLGRGGSWWKRSPQLYLWILYHRLAWIKSSLSLAGGAGWFRLSWNFGPCYCRLVCFILLSTCYDICRI